MSPTLNSPRPMDPNVNEETVEDSEEELEYLSIPEDSAQRLKDDGSMGQVQYLNTGSSNPRSFLNVDTSLMSESTESSTTKVDCPTLDVSPSTPKVTTVKSRPRPRPAYKGASGSKHDNIGLVNSHTSSSFSTSPVHVAAADAPLCFDGDTDLGENGIPFTYSSAVAERAKMRSRNATKSSAPISSVSLSPKTPAQQKRSKNIAFESEVIDITSDEEDLDELALRSSCTTKSKRQSRKPAKRMKLSHEGSTHTSHLPDESRPTIPLPSKSLEITLGGNGLKPSSPKPSPPKVRERRNAADDENDWRENKKERASSKPNPRPRPKQNRKAKDAKKTSKTKQSVDDSLVETPALGDSVTDFSILDVKATSPLPLSKVTSDRSLSVSGSNDKPRQTGKRKEMMVSTPSRKRGKGKTVILSADDDSDADHGNVGQQKPIRQESPHGRKADKARIVDLMNEDNPLEPDDSAVKENFHPDLGASTPAPPQVPSSSKLAFRTKSTPMTELIRRVNSLPGSPFSCSPSVSGSRTTTPAVTTYSPYTKSSRLALSRIAPLHPNRRPPPPPLPRPPPPKKTKKQLEREEKWEEELSESIEGWACLTDEERATLRRTKRDREEGLDE